MCAARGTYEISAETEKKEAVTATIAAGQSLYVRFEVTMGFFIGHVAPSIIDPQQAVNEIQECRNRQPAPSASAPPQPPAEAPSAAVTGPTAPAPAPNAAASPPAMTPASPPAVPAAAPPAPAAPATTP
ncbi:MAG: hypothetical protein JOZ13_06360 [Alphaproteobacteria bacterium]|nr:hypothetical protein [Alphaproteobacteria bacterium]